MKSSAFIIRAVLIYSTCVASFIVAPESNDTAQDHHSGEDLESTKDKNDPSRVVLVYTLESCDVDDTESTSHTENDTGASMHRSAYGHSFDKTDKAIEGQTNDDWKRVNRGLALNELRTRLNRTITRRLQKIERRRLSDEKIQEEFLGLRTSYLSALHMEIAEFPRMLEQTEAIELSQNLPCVQFVSKDYKIRPMNKTSHIAKQALAADMDQSEKSRSGDATRYSSLRQVQDTSPPMVNDPLYHAQWYLKSLPGGIAFDHVWEKYRNRMPKTSTIIAVADDGCDITHADLKTRLWQNPNENCHDGYDNDGNGFVDDCYGWDWVENDNWPVSSLSHGTSVSGIIAAEINNGIGMTGICWTCKIMCLKYIGRDGGAVSHQVAALNYAIKMGSKISNNSFGSYKPSALEREAIRRSAQYDHLVIASSGNDNFMTDSYERIHAPSAYDLDNIIAVASSTPALKKASFSNYGRRTVDLFAPGVQIESLDINNGYRTVYGTSYSTAVVTGIAGLIWSYFPELSYAQLKDVLLKSCSSSSSEFISMSQCGGIINMEKAMDLASERTKLPNKAAHPPAKKLSTSNFYVPNFKIFDSLFGSLNKATFP